MKVLLLASQGAEAEGMAEFCRKAFDEVMAFRGDWGQELPAQCEDWSGDLVVSYCSRWVVPANVLEAASMGAIHFHPGPPNYPGIGCLNWALYEGANFFGVTCHHMVPKVDCGSIIEARLFPLFPTDTVESLFSRTHTYLQALAFNTLAALAMGEGSFKSDAVWSGKMHSHKELDQLATITPDLDAAEIERRIRATLIRQWKPTIQVGWRQFKLMA